MSRTTRILRFLRHWHARFGVLAALFFLMLAVTGLALNHTRQLRLAERPVGTTWLMQWYGLEAETPATGYRLGTDYLVSDGSRWVMDGKRLRDGTGLVAGAVEFDGVRYIASASTLYLYLPDALLLDKLSGPALPVRAITRIGLADGRLVVEGDAGVYSSADGLDWQPFAGAVLWASPQPLPPALHGRLSREFAPSLPMERILLDVHSGRIFGRYGPVVMDLAALVLMVLALSGTWIYLRSIRRSRRG